VHEFLFSVPTLKQTAAQFFSQRRSLRVFRVHFHTADTDWGHTVQYVLGLLQVQFGTVNNVLNCD
jgi:hypothetical protein